MNGYLLDTHALLWAFAGDRRLRRRSMEIIRDVSSTICISIVTYWELQVKQTVGKLQVEVNFNAALCQWIETGAMRWLALTRDHCNQYRALALHHRDPFDRMLIAQAQVEKLAILTRDRVFRDYDVKVVW